MESDVSANLAEKRKEKIKIWLKDRHNLLFVLIFTLAILIRLYYFWLTKTQPLWWDEADYMAYAKNLAGFHVDWIVTPEHKSLSSFLVAAIFKIGLTEVVAKFVLQIIPSILSVFLVYFVCREMYKDKRVALIVSFLFATFWAHLFDTFRFHVDIPSLFTGLLAIYVFWRGYENNQKILGRIDPKWTIPITVLLVMLTYSIRRGHFILGVFFLAYMLLTRNWKSLLKDKYNWFALAIAMVILFAVEKTIFVSEEVGVGAFSTYFQRDLPINFLPLGVFRAYFESLGIGPNILLYLFWFGVILIALNVFLSLGSIRKLKNTTRADLFCLIQIILTLFFFIYIIRAQNAFGEPRWFFPLLLGSLVAISKATLTISDYIKPYSKHISILLIFLLIALGGYYEVKHADGIIKNRANSFTGIRQASLFVRDISNEDDIIISKGEPQVSYYSERRAIQPSRLVGWTGNDVPLNLTLEKIEETPEAKYLMVSFSEPNHPQWMQKVHYNQQGQQMAWEIPFMNTTINFATGQQDIKQSVTYGNLTFNLLKVEQEVFIYTITRE